jgi:SAM-dependent methyltransferase
MGTASVQGDFWSARASDWAEIQEALSRPVFDKIIAVAKIGTSKTVLDVGCGAGLFCELAAAGGASVAGLDAAPALLAIARKRVPAGDFRVGEMENLPFADATFDVVTGFNSFQYASSPVQALREAKRVVHKQGLVSVMVWGKPEDCDAAVYLKAVGSMLPPPPPGAPGPFALSVDGALEALVRQAGLTPIGVYDIDTPWHFLSLESALRGMNSAGPAVRAIRHSGEDAVRRAVAEAITPFRTESGAYLLSNKCRYLLAKP